MNPAGYMWVRFWLVEGVKFGGCILLGTPFRVLCFRSICEEHGHKDTMGHLDEDEIEVRQVRRKLLLTLDVRLTPLRPASRKLATVEPELADRTFRTCPRERITILSHLVAPTGYASRPCTMS